MGTESHGSQIVSSDCSFSVFPALPEIAIFKDSRAAESDIVKVTEGDACCF